MTNWMPISTAPKDGTRILVYGKYIDIAYWSNAEIWDEVGGNYYHWVVYDRDDDCYYSEHLIGEDKPTHWMPLPNPPLVV